MAQFQFYNKLLVSADEGITNRKIGNDVLGYDFYCQYPSYRGTFLSCIEGIWITVDGESVPEESVYFHLNGRQFLLSQLKDLYQEYWFILDKARVFVLKKGGLSSGKHEIRVVMRHRIPYTGYFGNYLVLDSDDAKAMLVGEGEAVL